MPGCMLNAVPNGAFSTYLTVVKEKASFFDGCCLPLFPVVQVSLQLVYLVYHSIFSIHQC